MANSAADAGGSELEIRKQADRETGRRRDGRRRAELLLHRDAAVTLWFLDRGKRGTRARGQGALHRRSQDLPPDRPRPPRLDGRSRSSSSPTSSASTGARSPRLPQGSSETDGGVVPRRRLRRRAGPVQGRDARRRSRRRAGASTPAGTSASQPAEDDGFDFRERLEELNEELEKLNARGAGAAGADRGECGGAAEVIAIKRARW